MTASSYWLLSAAASCAKVTPVDLDADPARFELCGDGPPPPLAAGGWGVVMSSALERALGDANAGITPRTAAALSPSAGTPSVADTYRNYVFVAVDASIAIADLGRPPRAEPQLFRLEGADACLIANAALHVHLIACAIDRLQFMPPLFAG